MLLRLCLFTIILSLVVLSCKDSGTTRSKNKVSTVQETIDTDHPHFVSDMETAHRKAILLQNELVCFNLDLTFGSGNSKMKIFTTTTSSAIRVDRNDGPSTVMIHGEIFSDADSSDWNKEKFGIYTYQYFFMAPFKFSDKGTIWTKMPDKEIEGVNTNRAKLTFEAGTGDAPDDWYIVHSDPTTHLVRYIAYIVTGGGIPVREAEKNAHAIKYGNYKMIAGVPMAHTWEFFNYSKESGLAEKIGEGIIKNVEMMDVVDQFDIINDGTYVKISG